MLDNRGLVNHCITAKKAKWGYVWGTFGQVLTPMIFFEKLRQYPTSVGKYKDFIHENWVGRRTADCVGLIKSYYWWNGSGPEYRSATDVSADGMFKIAKVKGPVRDFPHIPGLCVYKKGHIGVYIGDGKVIEAKGTKYGVVETEFVNGTWSHWLECPFIHYNKKKTFEELVMENSKGRGEDWIRAVETIKEMADADGDLGDLEIFKYLPILIENIGNK